MIPEDWQMCTIEDCCEILDSRRIPLNQDQRRERKGDIPYWGANGILDYVDDYLFNEPLILMAEDGGYFEEAKTRPICNLIDGKCWVNNHAHVLRTKSGVLREWVYFWFVHRDITHYINGGTRSKLNQADLRKLPLALPKFSVQKKIASILSSVDDAIHATQAVIDQTRRVKQGLLQQILTRGIGHTRFKQTEIGEIPECWEVRKLSTVAHIQTGIAKGKKCLEDPIELPYLRVANVQDGYIDITEIKTITVSKREVKRYSLQEGDVLLTEGGDFDKLGRGDVWHGQIEHCLHQNHVFAVRTDRSAILPEFYSSQASSVYGKKYFLSCAKQTTNLASINSTQLKSFPTIIPPLEEQIKIIKILYSIRTEEELTKESLNQLEKIKRGLMQDLLTGRVRVKLDREANT